MWGKRKLKKSALGCYKRDLQTVSDQTMRNRAGCKTQAENVFKKCLTKGAGGRTNERDGSRVGQHKDAAGRGNLA